MALRDENEPWFFETRTPQEMNQSNPVHAAEHEEFARKANEAVEALMELVENAPCPAVASTLLETVNQMSAVGLLMLSSKQREWVEKHRSELEAFQPGQPAAPQSNVPAVFRDIFKEFPGLEGGAA